LILLDIMMPGMSGWEVFKSLRENPSWEKIPVVFLTARTDNIAKNAGSFLGNDYIEKPFKLPELKERIDKILNEVK
jgi:DNA-binding response OmpR family regulator